MRSLRLRIGFEKAIQSAIFRQKSMSDGGYKIRNKEAAHFITFAVVEWVDVFTRKSYRDILLESIRHCQKEKGLILHAWCVMSNHIHLIASAANNNLSDVLRDFKKFTSKEIIKAITNNEQESRRECLPAGRQGCWKYSEKPDRKIAGIASFNFGGRTINQKKYIVQPSYFKN